MLTIASFNVNGIRAAVRRGFHTWLDVAAPDVVCLQEVRATDSVLRQHFDDDWNLAHCEPINAKGRAGVAIVTKHPFVDCRTDLMGDDGRWVEADLPLDDGRLATVVSAYVHTGEVDTPMQDEKYAFLGAITTRLDELISGGNAVIVCGDFNITPTDNDLKNAAGNRGKAGCHPDERKILSGWGSDLKMVDVAQHLAGDRRPPYTWWSYRGKAFDNDAGWRIDHHWVDHGTAQMARECRVDRDASYAERISDHSPVVASYALSVRQP